MLKSRVFLTATGVALALVLAGCNNPTGNNNGTVECTTHEWDWVLIPHSPLRDSHEAQTCRHCGATAETRDVAATPNFAWYGDGSAANFSIATPLSMFALAHIVNGTAREHGGPAQFDFYGRMITLASDIDLNDQPWTPIGTITQDFAVENGFNGTFNGSGRTITALYVNVDHHGAGLFSVIDSASRVKNLGVHGNVSGVYITGGIAGLNLGIVENVRFSGSVSGDEGTGGIVGWSQGTVSGSHNGGH